MVGTEVPALPPWHPGKVAAFAKDHPYLVLAVITGASVRIAPAVGHNFPLGDGGLFIQMALDLREHGFVPPEEVSYYGAPWVYPPLGIYILAAVPGDPVHTMTWLPLLASILIIPAVWLLARAFLDEATSGLAALAYALIPWSFVWLVQGGGVTRAPGLLLSLLALVALAKFRWMTYGVLLGLTVVTHPEAALFCVVSGVLLVPVRVRSLKVVRAVPIALAISSIWLVLLLPRLGVSGIANGVMSRSGGWGDDSIRKVIVLAEMWPLTLIGLLGIVVALRFARARWLVAWAVLCMVLPGAIGRWLAVPWALLTGVGLGPALAPFPRIGLPVAVAATALTFGVISTVTIPSLSRDDRARMTQIAATVDPDETYAVYGSEIVKEWFPYLAKHQSTTTGMGFEWVGGPPPLSADRVYRSRDAPSGLEGNPTAARQVRR